jgi:flavodoxin
LKTIVLYYSLSGNTKAEAERIAKEENAELCEIQETKKRSRFSAFVPGCLQARQRQTPAIKPLGHPLSNFDRIIIGCPIWAGFPAPAWNAVLQLLPEGKDVSLFFCSASGKTTQSQQGTKDLIAQKGCTLSGYRDIKTGTDKTHG